MFMVAPTFMGFFSDNQEVITLGATVLRMVAVSEPFYGFLIIVEGFMLGGPYMLTDVLGVLKNEVFPADKKVQFFGDGIDAYDAKIQEDLADAGYTLNENYFYADESFRHQDAASVGLLACEKAEAGDVLTIAELLPDYMRKAEAQQKLEAGQLPICKGPKQE